jgi:hypothetical protein
MGVVLLLWLLMRVLLWWERACEEVEWRGWRWWREVKDDGRQWMRKKRMMQQKE